MNSRPGTFVTSYFPSFVRRLSSIFFHPFFAFRNQAATQGSPYAPSHLPTFATSALKSLLRALCPLRFFSSSHLLTFLTSIIFLLVLAACGGGKKSSSPPNVGGGYTLQVSGGTLNDGSGVNGLVILATLRDESGSGPTPIETWHLTITGPGISSQNPLGVDYDDNSSGSYITWWWEGFDPMPGTYTAKATNGSVTLTYNFNIDTTSIIAKPALTKTADNRIEWNAVSGAGSYYYQVTDAYGSLPLASDYIDSDTSSTYSFPLPTFSTDGSYLVEVFAHTKSRVDLMNDPSPSPSLPLQENVSVSTMDLVVSGGSTGSYNLIAKGGTLYKGIFPVNESGTDRYGLVIWTSILTNTGDSPAGDWTITVTGPGLLPATDPEALKFTYPRTNSHYVYWDFGALPANGIYTVTATSLGYSFPLTASFEITDTAAKLLIAQNISVTSSPTGYTIGWDAVTGALSYNVNLWTCITSVPDDIDCLYGSYEEVANGWISGSAPRTAFIPKKTLISGVKYDIYITACTLDMTTMKNLPPPSPIQVNMSDNTYVPIVFTAQ